jgi:hypothetical protein
MARPSIVGNCAAAASFGTLLYNHCARTTQKTAYIFEGGLFNDPLSSIGRPIVASVGSRINVFTEPSRSNGSIRHIS